MRNIFLSSTAVVLLAAVGTVQAATLDDYLIVGRYVNDTAVDTSNYELGKISDLDAGNYEEVRDPGVGPSVGQSDDARIAILDTSGTVKMSDVNVYGTGSTGIDCAGSYNNCTDSGGNLSNTTYNGSAMNDANGVDGNVNMDELNATIDLAATWVAGLSNTGSIATSDGKITGDLTVNLSAGLNVLDFSGTNGNDVLVENGSLIFQGGADDYAVVLVDADSNFLTSNGNLVIGNGGIGLNNVVIVSQRQGTDANFGISNSYINGVALWDLGGDVQNNMSLDNVIGCTQLVGDDVDIQNVRLQQCAFNTSVIPIPAAAWLFGSGIAVLGWLRRKVTV